MVKTLKINDETHDRLMKAGTKGETFDKIISRLLESKDLDEVMIDMIVWSKERDPTIYDEFVSELRNNARARGVTVNHLIEKAEEWERT